MKIINKLLSLLYPNCCAFCQKGVSYNTAEFYICDSCMEKLNFCIRQRRCTVCGNPIDNPKYSICSECFSSKKNGVPIYYDRITAPLIYDENSKNAIFYFKRGQYLGAISTFCKLIKTMIDSDFANVKFDFLTAIPPSKERVRKINFDQAAVLAENLSKNMGIQYLPHSMKRIRETKRQSSLNSAERKTNLNGAFAVNRPQKLFKNKTILVVDDISTTGSTINECAKILKNSGAKKVYGAVIAKTSSNA